MCNEERRYQQRPRIVMRKIAGETLLIPVSPVADMRRVYTLNSTAEVVWAALGTPCTVRELGGKVAAQFDVEPERAEQDVRELIAALQAAAVIEEDAP